MAENRILVLMECKSLGALARAVWWSSEGGGLREVGSRENCRREIGVQKKILLSFAIKGNREMGEVLGRGVGVREGLFDVVCFPKMEVLQHVLMPMGALQ